MTAGATSVQIYIRPVVATVSVRAGGVLVARSSRALEVIEGTAPPVVYIPREDVAMDLLERTPADPGAGASRNPVTRYAIRTAAGRIEAAAWSHETPRPTLGAIAGRLAFHPDRSVTDLDPA
jgi:uncharacterized protein (DUF427 family)